MTKKKVENGKSKEKNLDETPKRSNVKETISKQKTRSKRLMKDVLESRDSDQQAAEPPKQTGDKTMLNEEQLKEMGVKMMFEMPTEKKTSHIKQAWKAPRLSNGRRNGNPQEIRSPQSHQIGSRALGMGLSRFARTQEDVLQIDSSDSQTLSYRMLHSSESAISYLFINVEIANSSNE